MNDDFKSIAEYAERCHDDANCQYDGQSYMVHVEMVAGMVRVYRDVFKNPLDAMATIAAAYCHDLIEDAKQSFNNVSDVTGIDIANIVLAVTDKPAENRLMRHLFTMPLTVKDHRAIILKLCDIHANATYAKAHGSSMYKKYVEEYQYRKPIFKKALSWYREYLNEEELKYLWETLDELLIIKTT